MTLHTVGYLLMLLPFGMIVFFGSRRWRGHFRDRSTLKAHPAVQAAVECWAQEMVQTVPAGDLTYERNADGEFVCVDAVVRPTDQQLARFRKALLAELANGPGASRMMVLAWGTPEMTRAVKAAGLENMPAPTCATMIIEPHRVRFSEGEFTENGPDVVWTADGGHRHRADYHTDDAPVYVEPTLLIA